MTAHSEAGKQGNHLTGNDDGGGAAVTGGTIGRRVIGRAGNGTGLAGGAVTGGGGLVVGVGAVGAWPRCTQRTMLAGHASWIGNRVKWSPTVP